ncbi:MAG: BPSS1780 family membrane protein [Burkholderiales bacterium]
MSAHPQPAAASAARGTLPRGDFNAEGRGVPMGNGWTWFASAWSFFRAAAGTWIGMVLALIIITIALNLLPIIGALVSTVLWPVFIAGLMIAARTSEEGGEARFAQLFAGFQQRFGPLVLLGVVSLIISIVVFFVVVAITGVQIFSVGASTNPDAVFRAMASVALAGLLMAALLLPLVMATWFAPALIALHGVGVGAAMKSSFVACMKNVLPFLLYGVIGLVASAIASVPLFLGWLVLGPVLFVSVYTSYRDIYFET